MNNFLNIQYTVSAHNFSTAGEASGHMKKTLKQLGFPPHIIRKATISLYEGEINMVIHAGGGEISAEIHKTKIRLLLTDSGPGIPDVSLAMQSGYSTATDSVRRLGFGAGTGLPNMKKYADKLEIQSQVGVGTSVLMEIEAAEHA